MAVKSHKYKNQGFFGIGIMNNVNGLNIGTLWRSAYIMGASYIFTIDKKYKKQMSDVTHTWKKIPLYHYKNFDDFYDNQPTATRIIAIELTEDAIDIADYEHPDQACYLLGNEQAGLAPKILKRCHGIVKLPGHFSLNVAVAGSILMYDRVAKLGGELPQNID